MSIDEKALAVIDRAMEWKDSVADTLRARDSLYSFGRGLSLAEACGDAVVGHMTHVDYFECLAMQAGAERRLVEALDAYTEAHLNDEDGDA